MTGDSELSIEETNKIRLSLGLKPLKVDTDDKAADAVASVPDESTEEGRERVAVENWKKHTASVEKEAAQKRRQDEIKKAREAAQRFRQLEGQGLAGDDNDATPEEGAAAWVKKMKKRQKRKADELARQMEEELERAAKERKEYTAAELQGLKVSHDFADLGEMGGETILTLKDSTIEENEAEGDELISTDLAERERLKERLDFKKKKPTYNSAYDDDDETGEKRLLSQYDDDEDKRRYKKRFILDGTDNLETNQAYRQEIAEKLKSKAISLDLPMLEVASDYMDPSNIKVRKPKKKKPKSTRKKTVLDDDVLNPTLSMDPAASASADGDVMQLDESSAFIPVRRIRKIAEDISFVDDDDLQSQLALQRRLALKKRKIMKPSDMARQVRGELENETSTPGAMEIDENGDEEVGLIIDGTSEFVATLRARTIPDRKVSTAPTAKNEGNKDSEEEDSDDDVDMVRDERSPKPEPSPTTSVLPTITSTGLDEETTISCGVGTTLAMLNQRGLLKRDPDAEKKIELARDRDRFRMEKRLREIEAEERAKAARARDRQSGKFERMSAREKEEHARWENKQRDVQEAREMQQRFKDYKPDVNLSYKDEFGREMNQKEAFKYLSHQFHGKGSGKAKTEKRLKKIEDEKKREAASSLNSAMDNAVSSAAKRSKQAGVRLM